MRDTNLYDVSLAVFNKLLVLKNLSSFRTMILERYFSMIFLKIIINTFFKII